MYVSAALATLASVVALFCKHVLHLPRPYSVVLTGDSRGFDLWPVQLMGNIHQYSFYPQGREPDYVYPPSDVLLYLPWVHVPHRVAAFELFVLCIFVVGAFLLARALVAKGISQFAAVSFVSVALLCSYPIWFELRQTNMEVFVFLLLVFALYGFVRERFNTAAVLIGFAAALKMLPIVFVALFLLRRQYRAAAVAITTALLLNVCCLFLITPSFIYSLHGFLSGLSAFSRGIVQTIIPRAIGYDHSVFTLVKYAQYAALGSLQGVDRTLRIYLLSVCIAGALFLWRLVRVLPLINQLLLITVASTFLSPSSFDYTLMHLYIPFSMLVLFAADQKESVAGLRPVCICLALINSPESFLIFHGRTYSGQFKAVVAMALIYLCSRFPFRSEFDSRYEGTKPNTLPNRAYQDVAA